MATPTYLFEDNFETGDASGWDVSEVDTSSQLDFPHYTVLARSSGVAMPYVGAYCARWVLASGNTDDATIGDDTIDIGAGETIWVRFNIWISQNTLDDTAADDEIKILEFQQTGGTVEFVFGLNIDVTNNVINWACGAADLTVNSASTAELDKWNTVDIKVNIVTAAATGEIEVYVTPDGQEPSSATTVTLGTTQNGAAVDKAILGVQDKLTGTVGTILIDDFKATVNGGARIFPDKDRFGTTKLTTISSHVFLGPGRVTGAMFGSSDNAGGDTVTIYDTDTGQAYEENKKLIMRSLNANETVQASQSLPFDVIRGCYVEVSNAGTTAVEAIVSFDSAPNWFSEGNIRRYALQRRV